MRAGTLKDTVETIERHAAALRVSKDPLARRVGSVLHLTAREKRKKLDELRR